jgi:hypothetical protein
LLHQEENLKLGIPSLFLIQNSLIKTWAYHAKYKIQSKWNHDWQGSQLVEPLLHYIWVTIQCICLSKNWTLSHLFLRDQVTWCISWFSKARTTKAESDSIQIFFQFFWWAHYTALIAPQLKLSIIRGSDTLRFNNISSRQKCISNDQNKFHIYIIHWIKM